MARRKSVAVLQPEEKREKPPASRMVLGEFRQCAALIASRFPIAAHVTDVQVQRLSMDTADGSLVIYSQMVAGEDLLRSMVTVWCAAKSIAPLNVRRHVPVRLEITSETGTFRFEKIEGQGWRLTGATVQVKAVSE